MDAVKMLSKLEAWKKEVAEKNMYYARLDPNEIDALIELLNQLSKRDSPAIGLTYGQTGGE